MADDEIQDQEQDEVDEAEGAADAEAQAIPDKQDEQEEAEAPEAAEEAPAPSLGFVSTAKADTVNPFDQFDEKPAKAANAEAKQQAKNPFDQFDNEVKDGKAYLPSGGPTQEALDANKRMAEQFPSEAATAPLNQEINPFDQFDDVSKDAHAHAGRDGAKGAPMIEAKTDQDWEGERKKLDENGHVEGTVQADPGPWESALRQAALAVLPGAGAGAVGSQGSGIGARIGSAIGGATMGARAGRIAGGVGAIGGALGGAFLGATAADQVQEWLMNKLGIDKTEFFSPERREADVRANPLSSFAGSQVGGVLGMGPELAGTLANKAVGAVLNTGLEAAHERNDEHFDPAKLAIAGAAGTFVKPHGILEHPFETVGNWFKARTAVKNGTATPDQERFASSPMPGTKEALATPEGKRAIEDFSTSASATPPGRAPNEEIGQVNDSLNLLPPPRPQIGGGDMMDIVNDTMRGRYDTATGAIQGEIAEPGQPGRPDLKNDPHKDTIAAEGNDIPVSGWYATPQPPPSRSDAIHDALVPADGSGYHSVTGESGRDLSKDAVARKGTDNLTGAPSTEGVIVGFDPGLKAALDNLPGGNNEPNVGRLGMAPAGPVDTGIAGAIPTPEEHATNPQPNEFGEPAPPAPPVQTKTDAAKPINFRPPQVPEQLPNGHFDLSGGEKLPTGNERPPAGKLSPKDEAYLKEFADNVPGAKGVADAVRQMPPERQRQVLANIRKLQAGETNFKTETKQARGPQNRYVNELGAKAPSAAARDAQNTALKAYKDAYDKYAPVEGETPEQAHQRAAAAAAEINSATGGKLFNPRKTGDDFPPHVEWAKQVRYAAGPQGTKPFSKKAIETFLNNERETRAGGGKDVADTRKIETNRDNSAEFQENRAPDDRYPTRTRIPREVGKNSKGELITDDPVAAAHNRLASWLEKLPDRDYEALHDAYYGKDARHPQNDLHTEVHESNDPEALYNELNDILDRANAPRKAKVTGPVTIDQFPPKSDISDKGRSLKGTKDFDRLAQEALASLKKAEGRSGDRLQEAEAENKEAKFDDWLKGKVKEFAQDSRGELHLGNLMKDLKGTFANWIGDKGLHIPEGEEAESRWNIIRNFMTDESGSMKVPEFLKRHPLDWLDRRDDTWKPNSDYLGNHLNTVRTKAINTKMDILKNAQAAEKEFGKLEAKDVTDMYRAAEQGKPMPDKRLQDYWDKYVEPMRQKHAQAYADLRAEMPMEIFPDPNPTYQPRMRKFRPDERDSDDPIRGFEHSLYTRPSSTLDRDFFSIRDQNDPNYHVVIQPLTDGTARLYYPGGTKRVDLHGLLMTGNKVRPDAVGVQFTMKDSTGKSRAFQVDNARANEINAVVKEKGPDGKMRPIEYHENPLAAWSHAYYDVKNALDNWRDLRKMKDYIDSNGLSTRDRKEAKDNGWIQTRLPEMRTTQYDGRGYPIYYPKKVAWAMDDFRKAGFEDMDWWRNLQMGMNKWLYGTGAFMPHILNEGTLHLIGEKANWFKKGGAARFYPAAYKSVMSQDHFQDLMREHGANSMYGGTLTSRLIDRVLATARDQLPPLGKSPSKWAGYVRDALYDASNKPMWASNDVMLTSAVMERMARGMSMHDAIHDPTEGAHQWISDYRIPTTVGEKWLGEEGGRFLQKVIADSSLFLFGRYHYGNLAALGKTISNATGKNGGKGVATAFKTAVGMGVAYAAKLALDEMAEKLTGVKGINTGWHGAFSIPHDFYEAMTGGDPAQMWRNVLSPSLATGAFMDVHSNKDFTGKPVVEPGDAPFAPMQRSPLYGAALQGTQLAGHVASKVFTPWGALEQALNRKNTSVGQGLGVFGAGLLGYRIPSEGKKQWDEVKKGPKIEQAARTRAKHPPHLPEVLYERLFGGR